MTIPKYGPDSYLIGGKDWDEDDCWKEFVKYDAINLRDENRITPVLK